MNRIGLVDVDGTRFPNLALMKISAFHKSLGDYVEWANPLFGNYDKVYMSKVFTFTPDCTDTYDCEVEKGGTGYDIQKALPIEIDMIQPDYSLYNITDTAYGFLTRGCPNKCKWCIVPKKEGLIRPYMDIEQISCGMKNAILMDNNILSSEYGLEQLKKIGDMGIHIDFNQGLDARLINEDVARLLGRIKWMKYIRLACDQSSQIPAVENAYQLLHQNGYHGRVFIYCLINDFKESVGRVEYLRRYEWATPFCQPYRDFNNPHQVIPQWQKDMARWANMRACYKSIDLPDYQPRKGFQFKEYYKQFSI